MVIIRHPDGTQMHVPEWMTRPDAALLEVRDVPRISLRALGELRNLIDTFLPVPDQARRGGDDKRQIPQSEAGGTVSPEQPPHLITDERREALIPLLSMVIARAMEASGPESPTTRGTGYEG
ncbi:MAG: hypothetical protein F4X91_07890 [Nitrospinae bacterium]|nr:hypothetical protein [Nitrospinota bacterium]